MQGIRRVGTIIVVLAAVLVPAGVRAQAPDAGSASSVQALGGVEANRGAIIKETVERWRSQFRPLDPVANTGGDEERLAAALQSAPAEKLLAASEAQTYEEALAAVSARWQGPSVVALEPGSPIANALGSTTSDLVFTPVTPCRIIDTRVATDPLLLGRIGPNLGKQFSVSLANSATQGGNAGTCNIPIAPAAVAINVTSTDQTGLGNLRAIETGGGIPNVSLLNYTPGVNLANAAVVRSAGALGGQNIFIYSGNSASQVVVDIMGYFAAPVATALACTSVYNAVATAVGAGGEVCADPPACPAATPPWRRCSTTTASTGSSYPR